MTAAEKILQKSLVASGLDSSEWNSIQAGLRDRAFFSAKVAEANILHAMRDLASKQAAGEMSLTDARLEMRRFLERVGYRPSDEDKDTIKDLYSQSRLDIIMKTNAATARGYVQMKIATTPGALAAAPAWELYRQRNPRGQGRDWPARWAAAYEAVSGSGAVEHRMIALKTSPIWQALGDGAGGFKDTLGNPYPPFAFNSGMRVRSVLRSDCEKLGLVAGGAGAEPPSVPAFNDGLSAKVPFNGVNDPAWKNLKASFGDQIAYKGGEVVWKSELLRDLARGEGSVRLGKSTPSLLSHYSGTDLEHLENTSLTVRGEWVAQHAGKHLAGSETDQRNIPLVPGDFELLPSLWRNPDLVLPGKYKGSSVLGLETFDECVLMLAIDHRSGAMPLSFWKTKSPRASGLMASRLRATLPQRTQTLYHNPL